ncbi:MAG: S9 family peptidase [Gemmatimonadetes bacterium]|nr:S9 family peptidase [Gemmatimonadota bacterium]
MNIRLISLCVAASMSIAVAPVIAQELSIDQLQSVTSQVGGRDAPAWAPDGSKIVYLSEEDGGLWAMSPQGGSPSRLASGVPGGINPRSNVQLRYSPDGRHIAFVKGADGGSEIFLFTVADKSVRRLTTQGARVASYSLSPDGRTIAFSSNRYGSSDIWTVSVADGRMQRLTTDRREEVFPSWTPDGARIVYTRLDENWVSHDVFAMPAAGGPAKLVLSDKGYFDYRQGAGFGYARVSPDGNTILFRSQRSGWANYWVAPMAGATAGAPRAIAAEATDQNEARWSPDGKSILFLSISNGTQSLKVVPAAGGAVNTLVNPDLGMAYRAEWSPDGQRISYTLGTPTAAEDLYLVAANGGPPRRLTNSEVAGTVAAGLVTPEKVSWTNDGYTINAYLYKPRYLAAGERAPVIMLVHGGPTGQFSDNYQLQPQYFASKGYVVLAPNVRGSSGYGKKFEDANNRDWGHGDLRDVVVGVNWIKQQPYVNPERVGITGISYGGMLTMYAVSFAPGVFQAAISGSGYGDVREFHTKVPVLQHIKLLNYELGHWPSTPAVDSIYRRSSSILKVKDATAPTMLIHGYGLDELDNFYPAFEFARAMRQADKVVAYQKYPNETYYVYRTDNTRQMLQDMLAFFDLYLKDQSAAGKELAEKGR